MTIKEKLEEIQATQATIDNLLKKGDFATDMCANQWILEPFYEDKDCDIGLVHVKYCSYGACKPHIHPDAKEYLIVVSGAVILNINGNNVRTLNEGDCGVINPGEMHYSKPIKNNTKIAYVCVPSDSGMQELRKQLGQKNDRQHIEN